MTITETIATDDAAIVTAQAALDEAHARRASDQALLDAAQPHLSVLAEIEQFLEKLPSEAHDAFTALLAKARGLF